METTLKQPDKRFRSVDSDHDAEDDVNPPINASASTSKLRSTDGESKKRRKTKVKTPGIVYISRLPPGMTPQKVRHLMARWGDVGKVYAQRKDCSYTSLNSSHHSSRCSYVTDVGLFASFKANAVIAIAPTGYNPNANTPQKKQKHASANFSEAWVEFLDKSVAKTVASMLNAQVIGGKKGDRCVNPPQKSVV